MCLAVAGKLIEIDGARGRVNVRGNTIDVRLDVVPEAGVGDHVLVHAGFAITVITPEDAAATDAAFEELDRADRVE